MKEEYEALVKREASFEQLMDVVSVLRSKNGCPWDREQTNASLKNDTLEEAYEVIEAINNKDDDNLSEELGDLLLNVALHTRIAEEANRFDRKIVLETIVEKMVRRHPHVFGEMKLDDSDQVLETWDEIKKKEKSYDSVTDTMHGVAKALPALIRSQKVQKKAAKVGFDFENEKQLFDKLNEEIDEFKEAIQKADKTAMEEEIGDVFFQMVNISRFFEINAENALTKAIEKFINRFEDLEQLATAKDNTLSQLSLKQMDDLWNQIKQSKKDC